MCHPPSSSRTRGPVHEVASRPNLHRGAPPPAPWDLSPSGQNGWFRRRPGPPPAIPAAESALGLRPRSALSSAQVLSEWKTSTPPCNTFPSNGDYPLNSLSHPRGSLQTFPPTPLPLIETTGDRCTGACAVGVRKCPRIFPLSSGSRPVTLAAKVSDGSGAMERGIDEVPYRPESVGMEERNGSHGGGRAYD
jgi:hypothetical protein